VGFGLGFQTFGVLEFARNCIATAGLALVVLGQMIRWIAIRTLGEYFTVDVAIQEGQETIDKGVYKLIRHPSYAGFLLSFLGLGLLIGNWLSIVITFLPPLLMFIRRMNIEEELLCEQLGDEYRDYMERTKRLIPMVY
jgi:protein-S-isoprenylcysteine O-methyltransferase Ste14